ncbi:HLGFF motif protein [Neisseria sp. CCUG17229]|uniref:HLGFF motif protein n=1 Tax=Neisseria sp. CCUG17229 TaxID=3392036 RepID=UPI003A1003C1
MHYFSIHTQQGEHLGFFIMLADDESEAQPQSGQFAVKLQSEAVPRDQVAVAALQPWQEVAEPLFWRVEKDRVELFAGDANIGTIRNEYLTLSGQMLVLNDLTGMM